jgi:PPP family 3-phenylpropionic acid transporter
VAIYLCGVAFLCDFTYDPVMATRRPAPHKTILSAQYFLYFGALGVYLPYFNLYCYHLNFSGPQIGILSGLRTISILFFPLLWGALADRFSIRKPIYLFCNFASAGIWSLFLFTADFHVMVAITAAYGVFFAPLISFLEAYSMDLLAQEKRRYGNIRAWGSVSFILVVLVVGRLIGVYSVNMIVVLILIGSILQALMALTIPAVEKRERHHTPGVAGALFRGDMIMFLLCSFLMLVSHGAYYGFFSIHLENLGYGSTFIGGAWALASLAEILVMISSGHLFNRFRPQSIISFAFLVAAARWFLLYRFDGIWGILITQVLHAVTYGAFHMACILHMDSLTAPHMKTIGQAVNNSVAYGLGLTVGFLLSGYLYESVGAHTLFAVSGVIALVGGGIFKGYGLFREKR